MNDSTTCTCPAITADDVLDAVDALHTLTIRRESIAAAFVWTVEAHR